MAAKLVPKLILEGTRLTHKTDLAFALHEHPRVVGPRRYRYHSPIVSAEWGSLTNQPWGRGLINFGPDEEEVALEAYRTWVRLFELLRYEAEGQPTKVQSAPELAYIDWTAAQVVGATSGGDIYVSPTGDDWQQVGSISGDAGALEVGSDVWYAATEDAVYSSMDGGRTWKSVAETS